MRERRNPVPSVSCAELERLNAAVIDAMPDWLILVNMDGKVTSVNSAFEKMTGYKKSELVGKDAADLAQKLIKSKKDLEKTMESLGSALKGKVPTPRVHTVVTKDGREVSILATLSLMKDAEGKPTTVIVAFKNITERKQTEEVLRESENWYRTIFEDSPVSLWVEDFSDIKRFIDSLRDSGVKDLRTYFENNPEAVAKCVAMVKVIDVNKATMESYKGRSKEEFYAGLEGVFNEEAYDDFRESLISISEGKPRFETEGISQTLTGEKNHIFIRWTVVPGYEKTWSRVLVSITDITERKKLEEEMIKAAAEKRRMEELEKFVNAVIGRELRMVELKERIKELESKLKKVTGKGER